MNFDALQIERQPLFDAAAELLNSSIINVYIADLYRGEAVQAWIDCLYTFL
jgi:hypothetical protein